MSVEPNPPCQLYLISPPELEPAAFLPLLTAALDAGPVAAFQLRLPGADEATLRAAINVLRPEVQRRDIAFLIAGDPALARETGCDGVHLEQMPPRFKAVRAAAGDDLMLGVSCGASRHQAMTAAEEGADYVSFGPLWDTVTKDRPADPLALQTLTWWAEMMETPCVGVGGVTPDTAAQAVASGADFLAVVHAVWTHPDGPAEAIRRLLEAMGTGR